MHIYHRAVDSHRVFRHGNSRDSHRRKRPRTLLVSTQGLHTYIYVCVCVCTTYLLLVSTQGLHIYIYIYIYIFTTYLLLVSTQALHTYIYIYIYMYNMSSTRQPSRSALQYIYICIYIYVCTTYLLLVSTQGGHFSHRLYTHMSMCVCVVTNVFETVIMQSHLGGYTALSHKIATQIEHKQLRLNTNNSD